MGHVVFLKVFFGVTVVVPAFGDVEGAVFFDLWNVGLQAYVADGASGVSAGFHDFVYGIPLVRLEFGSKRQELVKGFLRVVGDTTAFSYGDVVSGDYFVEFCSCGVISQEGLLKI